MRGLRSVLMVSSLLLAAAAGGAGCNTYKYFDVQVTFDATANPPFTRASAFSVQVCQMVVSGADHAEFDLPDGKCPNMVPGGDPLNGGSFEFSTFASSGTIIFTLDAFQDVQRTAPCKIGHGELALPVTGLVTTTGELKVKNTGMSCVGTGGIQGDASVILD